MGATPGDGLPWPPGYEGVPADVPNDLQKLAEATQVALDKRMPVVPEAALVAPATGWSNAISTGFGQPIVRRSGRLVVSMGLMTRTSTLAVADNGVYQVGTIPAGYRPTNAIRAAAGWLANNGTTPQLMTTQLLIETDGTVSLVSNVAGSMAVNHWVSLGGIAWFTS